MEKFYDFYEENIDQLNSFIPIVERVHGPHHQEFYEVARLFERVKAKVRAKDSNMDDEFLRLEKVTDSYKIPDDVCETYEHVYKVLEKLNSLYDNK
ncbi:MAG: iron-sulfur cluster repair di-iron protein, ric [Bacillota bacterium]|nr:iron-sulfur cluster repair di-iron protein, ric [Bacillota bacterium]